MIRPGTYVTSSAPSSSSTRSPIAALASMRSARASGGRVASRHALDPNPCGRRRARTRPRPGAGSAPKRTFHSRRSVQIALPGDGLRSVVGNPRAEALADRSSFRSGPTENGLTNDHPRQLDSERSRDLCADLARRNGPWPSKGDDPKRSAAYSGNDVEAVGRDDDIRWIDREIDREPSLDGRLLRCRLLG